MYHVGYRVGAAISDFVIICLVYFLFKKVKFLIPIGEAIKGPLKKTMFYVGLVGWVLIGVAAVLGLLLTAYLSLKGIISSALVANAAITFILGAGVGALLLRLVFKRVKPRT